jgi:hypothetical protein
MQREGDDDRQVGTLEAVELAAVGQVGKERAQVAIGPAPKPAFGAKLGPLAEDGERDDFTDTQRGQGTRMRCRFGHLGLAEGIDLDVQRDQAGLGIEHGGGSGVTRRVSTPTVSAQDLPV